MLIFFFPISFKRTQIEQSFGLPWWLRGKESTCDAGDTEMWVWYLGQEDPLELEMATHSSTLAWRIPWTEELGGLQSMGSQRAGHDWVHTHTHTHTNTFILLYKCMHVSVICTTFYFLWILLLIFYDYFLPFFLFLYRLFTPIVNMHTQI